MAILLLMLQSCVGIQVNQEGEEDTVLLTVNAGVEGKTKSQYTPDENSIHDLNLYVFDSGGRLVASRYESSSPAKVCFELAAAEDYSIRAVANYGAEKSFADEAELLSWKLQWPEFQRNGYMLMCGSAKSTPMGSSADVYISLKRLASKVSFSIDDSALGKVHITSVQLCQVPVATTPFIDSNKALSSSDVRAGDSASQADLNQLNNGAEVFFYTFENMQGTLLPQNSDPWEKVPDSISAVSELCSYVEVNGEFDGVSSIFSGNITYRFYLGADNCRNFDVRRNTDYGISLIMSTDLDAVSWKISTDATVVEEGHGHGYIYAGRQGSTSSLYVGECFKYAVEVDEALSAYFAGSPENAKLMLCNASGGECNELELGSLYLEDGIWMCDARCLAVCSAQRDIWLYDPIRDRKVQKLSAGVKIAMPKIVFSNSTSSQPEALDRIPITINNSMNMVRVFLTDTEGNNLGGQWYDNTVINLSISVSVDNSDYKTVKSLVKTVVNKTEKNGSYYANIRIPFSYTGTPQLTGFLLSELCATKSESLQLVLSCSGAQTKIPLLFKHYTIGINYDASTLDLKVNNISKLPVSLTYYDFTWFGPYTDSYDGITEDTALTYQYANGGESYYAYRLDCVSYENQSFGYTKPANLSAQNGIYSLSSNLFDYNNAYALFNKANCSSSTAYSKTYTVFDVSLKGRKTSYSMKASDVSTTTGQTEADSDPCGMHAGVVIFSNGAYLKGSEGVEAIDGSPSVARADKAIIYAPSHLNSSLASPGSISYSQTYCTSGANSGSTEYLSIGLNGGCESVVNLTYKQIAALRTLPNGYGDNLFTTYSYYWKGPGRYSSSLSNPGNNTLSYIYQPGQSGEVAVSGSYGSNKFKSSNYSQYSSLSSSYSATLKSGGGLVKIIPILSFINSRVFSLTETDSAVSSGKSKVYAHRYHPADCYIEGTIRTAAPEALYKCALPKLYRSQMKYLNSNYEGFYMWIWRDVSAPLFCTQLESCSAGSNCDKYTTWYFKNAASGTNDLKAGTCILISNTQ